MSSIPFVLILAFAILIASVCAQFAVGKIFKHSFLREHHGVVEPLLGVVGTLYSVLLGFMVGGAMDRYEDCVIMVDQEANSMTNVFRLAQGLEKLDRVRIRQICRRYASNVVEKEWREMVENKPAIDGAHADFSDLWQAALSIQPKDDQRITNIQQALLESMDALAESRRLRIVSSQHSLTIAQWLVIGVGSFITVLFCLLFPINRASFQTFFTGLVSVSLGLNVWLLADYSTPFSGELSIQPYMFMLNVQQAFKYADTESRYLSEDDRE